MLERERGVEHLFHGIEPMSFDVALDLAGVRRRVLDDLCIALILAAPELQIILREIGVSEDVGGHQDIVGDAVAGREVGVSGVAGEHHLEQARIAHMPLQQLVDVTRSEGPMRHPHRQSVNGDLGHEAVRHRLEDDGRPVEPEPSRQILDLRNVSSPVGRHGAPPISSSPASACASALKKWRTAGATSSGPAMEKRLHGSPSSIAD